MRSGDPRELLSIIVMPVRLIYSVCGRHVLRCVIRSSFEVGRRSYEAFRYDSDETKLILNERLLMLTPREAAILSEEHELEAVCPGQQFHISAVVQDPVCAGFA